MSPLSVRVSDPAEESLEEIEEESRSVHRTKKEPEMDPVRRFPLVSMGVHDVLTEESSVFATVNDAPSRVTFVLLTLKRISSRITVFVPPAVFTFVAASNRRAPIVRLLPAIAEPSALVSAFAIAEIFERTDAWSVPMISAFAPTLSLPMKSSPSPAASPSFAEILSLEETPLAFTDPDPDVDEATACPVSQS